MVVELTFDKFDDQTCCFHCANGYPFRVYTVDILSEISRSVGGLRRGDRVVLELVGGRYYTWYLVRICSKPIEINWQQDGF